MKKNLLSRLDEGPVIFAEGYLFAMERRGYLSAGPFVPEVVLEHPDVVSQLHREFIRAGSDIVQAFTYYGHREKLRIIGKEHLLEQMQKNALKIAKDAANEFKDLDLMVCGDVANTNIFDPKDKNSFKECQKMYEEQVLWAKEAGVDFIVAETINWVNEMKIALNAIKKENARPFKVAKNVEMMVIDSKTGEKANFGSAETIIESFKKNTIEKNILNGNDQSITTKNNILKFY